VEPEVTWIIRPLEPDSRPASTILARPPVEAPAQSRLWTHVLAGAVSGAVAAALVVTFSSRARPPQAMPAVTASAPISVPVIVGAAEPEPVHVVVTRRPVHSRRHAANVVPIAPRPEELVPVTTPQPEPAQPPPAQVAEQEQTEAPTDVAEDESPEGTPVSAMAAPPEQLTTEQVGEVIAVNQGQISDCVQAEKARRPYASGRVMMSWSILANGEAADIGAENPAVAPALTDCLQNAILDWTFPEHTGEAQPVRRGFAF
jgi:hypothetical protein